LPIGLTEFVQGVPFPPSLVPFLCAGGGSLGTIGVRWRLAGLRDMRYTVVALRAPSSKARVYYDKGIFCVLLSS
jgi:hypothetical protein